MDCPDCAVKIGERHMPGCDVERCPRCGMQMISCDCIYVVNGMEPDTLETEHPDIFKEGPTDEMYLLWEREWGNKSMPWTGVWPGVRECQEYGWYAKFEEGKGWMPCDQDEPGATEDLNRLVVEARWDAEQQKMVRVS